MRRIAAQSKKWSMYRERGQLGRLSLPMPKPASSNLKNNKKIKRRAASAEPRGGRSLAAIGGSLAA
jgi:hypothetical protein